MMTGTDIARGRATGLAALLAGLALGACAGVGMDTRAKFASLEGQLRDQGKFRTDYAPVDAPFTKDDLIRNFETVALHWGEGPDGDAAPGETQVTLIKMSPPLRWHLQPTNSYPTDLRDMEVLMKRVGALTSLDPEMLPYSQVREVGDLIILVLDSSEREALLAGQFMPGLARHSPFIAGWVRDEDQPCVAQSRALANGSQKGASVMVVLIRNELEGLFRRHCIEEAALKSLGLRNDGDDVRPSMFNDGAEFALMTRHDEFLLRILYDPRLKADMTADQAMPIVRTIVAGLDLTADPAAGVGATQ